MSPAVIRNGLLLIFIGVVILLCNLDYLSWEVWRSILPLWPLLLISIGLEKILVAARMRGLAFLPPIGLILILVWVAWLRYPEYAETTSDRVARIAVDPDPQYKRATLKLRLTSPRIEFHPDTDQILEAECEYTFFAPRLSTAHQDSIVDLVLEDQDRWLRPASFFRRWPGNNWEVGLTSQIPWSISLFCRDAEFDFNFKKIQVADFNWNGKKGHLHLCLGSELSRMRVKVAAPQATLDLEIPENCGLQLIGITERQKDELTPFRFEKVEGKYRTPNFSTAATTVELDLIGGLKRLNVLTY